MNEYQEGEGKEPNRKIEGHDAAVRSLAHHPARSWGGQELEGISLPGEQLKSLPFAGHPQSGVGRVPGRFGQAEASEPSEG